MSGYDLAIAYRIYPKVSKPALGLPASDDKLLLSEICLRSFKQSLGDLRVKMWVLLDGCTEDYDQLFRKYFDSQDLFLIRLQGEGNRSTFAKQVDILLKQNDSEFVYFAEDDYLYLPNQFSKMLDFMRAHSDVHFITPYDHLDCYTRQIHNLPKWIRIHGNQHWRTAASTCLTFLTRRRTLLRKKYLFLTYSWRNLDCSLWLSLTKFSLFSPVEFVRFIFRDRLFAKIIAKAWLYGWPQIMFGKRMKLWAPIPALATHLDIAAMSPVIDWIAFMRHQSDSIAAQNSQKADLVSSTRIIEGL